MSHLSAFTFRPLYAPTLPAWQMLIFQQAIVSQFPSWRIRRFLVWCQIAILIGFKLFRALQRDPLFPKWGTWSRLWHSWRQSHDLRSLVAPSWEHLPWRGRQACWCNDLRPFEWGFGPHRPPLDLSYRTALWSPPWLYCNQLIACLVRN